MSVVWAQMLRNFLNSQITAYFPRGVHIIDEIRQLYLGVVQQYKGLLCYRNVVFFFQSSTKRAIQAISKPYPRKRAIQVGMVALGWWLDKMILVVLSSLNNSIILWFWWPVSLLILSEQLSVLQAVSPSAWTAKSSSMAKARVSQKQTCLPLTSPLCL